jgi:DNA-binding transcriptional ArsR family regulator
MTDGFAASRAFGALADPLRRAIVERLATAPLAVGEIARGLPVTRPAVSQHLKILKEAGLVAETPSGTRRIYRLDPRGIGVMRAWLDAYWSDPAPDEPHDGAVREPATGGR